MSAEAAFCVFLGLASFSWGQDAEAPDKPAEYFFSNCATCHTVGGGELVGPDLMDSTKWKREDLKMAIKAMEENVGPISDEALEQMVEFLKDLNVSQRIAKYEEENERKSHEGLTPPSFETGQELFRGQKMLLNGGPACISCHHFVNEGGNLGPDLALIKDRASGVVLQSAIENSSYKIMRPIYEKHKITKEEALHLSEYLTHPGKVDARFVLTLQKVSGLALGCLGASLVLLWNLNQGRKGPTRKNLLLKNLKR